MEPYWTQWTAPPCSWLAGGGACIATQASNLQTCSLKLASGAKSRVYASHLQLDSHMSATFRPNQRDGPSASMHVYAGNRTRYV